MNVCLILTLFGDREIWVSRPNSFRFLFFGLNGVWSLKRNVDTPDELLSPILDAAARINKNEDELRRRSYGPRAKDAKWTETDVGILDHLLWTVTKFAFSGNESVFLSIKLKLKLK